MSKENTMQSAVIDRIEDEWAVVFLQNEQQPINVLLSVLPLGIKEGDYLQMEVHNGEIIRAEIDPDAKAEAERRIQAKLERLRHGDHLKGDTDAASDELE
jgi:hypothetical protein